jgi:DcuC family C4-dicarboxylate transporter
MLVFVSLIVIVAAIYSIARGIDVRLSLLGASFVLAGMNGDVTPIVRELLGTFSNEKFVIPICTAMGFAYVLKQTQCDQHLVRLLTRPLQKGRWFLIPGVVCVGFLVNIPIISQTSTAVCIGAVVVPLMQAARISPVIIGASILLGASIGGELLNPGAPELNTVGEKLGVKPTTVVNHLYPLVIPHLIVAGLIFWWMSYRYERRQPSPPTEEEAFVIDKANVLRALVPLVPLVLLFLTGPPLNLLQIPEHWVVDAKSKAAYGTRLIGLAMLVGVVVAMLVTPRSINRIPGAFFDGAGYAFANIVSLIVTANCFGKAIDQVGLAKLVGEWISTSVNLLHPISALLPMGFATVSGSGMAATQSLYELYVEPCRTLELDPMDVGGMVSLGAAAGRTMSPVAAVALMSARLTGTSSFQLAARVAPPLILSMALLVVLRMLGVV